MAQTSRSRVEPTREERLVGGIRVAVEQLVAEVEELESTVADGRTREAFAAVRDYLTGAGLHDLRRAQEWLEDHLVKDVIADETPGMRLEPDLILEDHDGPEEVNP